MSLVIFYSSLILKKSIFGTTDIVKNRIILNYKDNQTKQHPVHRLNLLFLSLNATDA